MSTRRIVLSAVALLAALWLLQSPAMASKVAGPTISGTVTAVSGIDAVAINGQTYRIQPGSAAAAALPNISVGQVVDAVLDGPADSSASEVIAISLHTS
jgi:hypothetical protein